jgi:hypothetical protein
MHLKLDPPQDWSRFNRISLWCYLHPTENTFTSFSLGFLCDGATAGPSDPIALHYFGDLRPGEWNFLIWEIPEYPRDRVSDIVIFQPLSGNPKKGMDSTLIYDD